MSTTIKTTVRLSAIALGIIIVNIYSFPLNAQTDASEEVLLENLEVEEEGSWSFSSEDETISIQDNLEKLGEYDISTPHDSDWRLTEEERRWGNRGDRPDYTLETEVYNY